MYKCLSKGKERPFQAKYYRFIIREVFNFLTGQCIPMEIALFFHSLSNWVRRVLVCHVWSCQFLLCVFQRLNPSDMAGWHQFLSRSIFTLSNTNRWGKSLDWACFEFGWSDRSKIKALFGKSSSSAAAWRNVRLCHINTRANICI